MMALEETKKIEEMAGLKGFKLETNQTPKYGLHHVLISIRNSHKRFRFWTFETGVKYLNELE